MRSLCKYANMIHRLIIWLYWVRFTHTHIHITFINMLQTSLSNAHLLWLQRKWKMVFSISRLRYNVSLLLRTESSKIGRRRKHYYTLPLHLPVLTGALKYFPIWSARIHALLFRKTLSYCKIMPHLLSTNYVHLQ